MNIFFPPAASVQNFLERRLMGLSTLAVTLSSLILTLSPAVRLHSFQVEYRWIHWIGWAAWLVLFSLAIVSSIVKWKNTIPTCYPSPVC